MDRSKCKLIEDEALDALKVLIEEKFGVKVSFKGGRFDNGMAQLKFEFAEVKADGSVSSQEAEDYKRLASLCGLPADGMGKEFVFRGSSYKVVGMKPRSKYSILAERQPDGKRFKFEPRTAFGPSCLRSPFEDEEAAVNRAEALGS